MTVVSLWATSFMGQMQKRTGHGVQFSDCDWNACPTTSHCTTLPPFAVHSPASTDRLHIWAFQNCEFWRVLAATSDVAIVTQFKGVSWTASHQRYL